MGFNSGFKGLIATINYLLNNYIWSWGRVEFERGP